MPRETNIFRPSKHSTVVELEAGAEVVFCAHAVTVRILAKAAARSHMFDVFVVDCGLANMLGDRFCWSVLYLGKL